MAVPVRVFAFGRFCVRVGPGGAAGGRIGAQHAQVCVRQWCMRRADALSVLCMSRDPWGLAACHAAHAAPSLALSLPAEQEPTTDSRPHQQEPQLLRAGEAAEDQGVTARPAWRSMRSAARPRAQHAAPGHSALAAQHSSNALFPFRPLAALFLGRARRAACHALCFPPGRFTAGCQCCFRMHWGACSASVPCCTVTVCVL